MIESGDIDRNDMLTKEKLKALIKEKIDILDIQKVKQEVQVFIKDHSLLDFWSKDYFYLLADKMVF